MNIDDDRKRAIALLLAIKGNIQFPSTLEMSFVNEYHSVLDKLEKTGIDVSDFRLPDSWMRIETGYEWMGRVVKRELFLIKLQAILQYLS